MRPIYLIFKIGNNDALDHRMIVDYYDPLEWGHSEAQERLHFSGWMKTVYGIMRVDRNWNWKRLVHPVGDKIISGRGPIVASLDEKHSSYKSREFLLDVDAVSTRIHEPDLLMKLQSANPVDILDAASLGITEDLIKLSRTMDQQDVRDRNLVSSGDFDVGTAGDYATFVAALTDATTLTADLNFTQISDVTESGAAFGTVNCQNYNLSYLTDTPHGGDVTTGHIVKVTYTGDFHMKMKNSTGGTGYMVVDGLHYRFDANPSSAGYALRFGNYDGPKNHRLANTFMDGNGNGNANGLYMSCTGSGNEVYNCVVWDLNWGLLGDINAPYSFYNCTAYNCGTLGFYGGNGGANYKSCVSFNAGIDDFDSTTDTATKVNCGSSDLTANGTDPQESLTAANEIETDDTDSAFAQPITGAVIATNGNTSHASSDGMAGVTWDVSDPSIGAFQFPPAAGGSLLLMERSIANYGGMRQ